MKNLLSILAMLVLTLTVVQVDAQRSCSAMNEYQAQIEADPQRAVRLEQIERHTLEYLKSNPNQKMEGLITIPVVFHIVYKNGTENISEGQIQTQMNVLNEDFRRLNADADNVWSQATDSEIEFCLATVDPDGNETNGITRTETTVSSFGSNGNPVKFDATGGKDAWPADQYMNFWVCALDGFLGYAQFPGGPAATDGIVCDYKYVGTNGTATAPFDLGRTATHEVGHYLNLRHIWGDGPCGADDFVSDTPASDGSNFGCALGHVSCGTEDMVQNYMDYSDDGCMNLFTVGQKDRMRALFAAGGFREALMNSTVCGDPPPPTCDDGIQNGQETGIDCGGPDCPTCPEEPTCDDGIQNGQETGVDCGGPDCPSCPVEPTCDDGIQNGQETGIDCGGPDCVPCAAPCTDVDISIQFDNYPEETSWDIKDEAGNVIASGGTYGNEPDGGTVSETACLEDGCYTFTIKDSFGDGICCAFGNGSYSVSVNGEVLASGSSFNASESTSICIGDMTGPTCDDGIQNGQETGIDCGGPDCPSCPVEPTCTDGIQNGQETGVDCGGPDCPSCPVEPTCDDGIQNGQETGVDCGGPDCVPCQTGCTDVVVSIQLDNYPEETSWELRNGAGNVIASGGTYGNEPDGGVVSSTVCLNEGCYTFTMYDAFGDGICCIYGNGSYSVTANGEVLASGGSFGASESTSICIGDMTGPTCNDGIQNGQETGVDCGGPDCPSCPEEPSCDDGIQNGQETGIDCGGPDCAPCNTDCTYSIYNSTDLESGLGIWNDGGSDCRRSAVDASYANSGSYCVRLRDNSTSSVLTSDNLPLAGASAISVSFSYVTRSMDNASEGFLVEISLDGGSSYSTMKAYRLGTDFENDVRGNATISFDGTLTNSTVIRFRCDASTNTDWVYLDDIEVSICGGSNTRNNIVTAKPVDVIQSLDILSNAKLYPNPAFDEVTLAYRLGEESEVNIMVYDIAGRQVYLQNENQDTGDQEVDIPVTNLDLGLYYVVVQTANESVVKKFVKAQR